jgi:hypothetical protein
MIFGQALCKMPKYLPNVGCFIIAALLAASTFCFGQVATAPGHADAPSQTTQPHSTTANPPQPPNWLGSGDHEKVAFLVAGMSAQIGSIVVVFIAFAIQEARKLTSHVTPLESYRDEREKSRLHMLRVNGAMSMIALIVCPIFVAFGMATKALPGEWIDGIAIAMFTFGIFVLLLTLVAYLALESPFHYAPAFKDRL